MRRNRCSRSGRNHCSQSPEYALSLTRGEIDFPAWGDRVSLPVRELPVEAGRIRSKLRDPLFNFAAHLFDVDVQSVAIDRTVGLEVEDSRERVAANSLLVDRALNRVNRIVHRLIPETRKLKIVPVPAISSLTRDPGSFTSVKNYTLHVLAQR